VSQSGGRYGLSTDNWIDIGKTPQASVSCCSSINRWCKRQAAEPQRQTSIDELEFEKQKQLISRRNRSARKLRKSNFKIQQEEKLESCAGSMSAKRS
jgi:hypothetical protein